MSDNENAPLFANPLPPSQFENPSFNFNGGQLGVATDPKLAPGVFAFDVQVDIATAGMRQVSYTNVAGLINGNISGNVETTVDIAKFSTNRDTLLGLSEEFHKLSVLISNSKLAYETADVVGKIKNGTEVPLNDLFELSRSYTNILYDYLGTSPGNTIENLNELLDSANDVADLISGISGDPVSAAKVIASNAVNITSLLSIYFEVWANDPPDPNFTRLEDISEKADAVASKFIELADVPEFAEQREHLLYLTQTIKLAANNVAALTAYERFQGALLAGDYRLAQAQAMLMQKHLISADVDADAYATLLEVLIAKNETGFDPLPPEIMGDILELFNILKQRLAESPEQVDDFFLPTFYSVPVILDEFFLQAEAALLQELSAPLLSKLLESGQREQIVLFCPGQILQVDHGRQVSGQGE